MPIVTGQNRIRHPLPIVLSLPAIGETHLRNVGLVDAVDRASPCACTYSRTEEPPTRSEIAAMVGLGDQPDWLYLLNEFDAVYRRGSAGGRGGIRGHQRRVRARLRLILRTQKDLTLRAPEDKPVLVHLGRALDLSSPGPLAGMARTVVRLKHLLTWEWGYQQISKDLAKRYAYCEVLGPQGPVVANSLILGLVLFAPGTTYPRHSHTDIEESYISLGGAWSENDGAVYAPGSLILNRPGHEHRITIGDREPCLLAYAWIGPPERLTEPGMKFSNKSRRP